MQIIVDSNKMKALKKSNTTTKYIYLILHGFRADGIVRADYGDINEYSGISLKTIASSIKELIKGDYITRISRGKYTINK